MCVYYPAVLTRPLRGVGAPTPRRRRDLSAATPRLFCDVVMNFWVAKTSCTTPPRAPRRQHPAATLLRRRRSDGVKGTRIARASRDHRDPTSLRMLPDVRRGRDSLRHRRVRCSIDKTCGSEEAVGRLWPVPGAQRGVGVRGAGFLVFFFRGVSRCWGLLKFASSSY